MDSQEIEHSIRIADLIFRSLKNNLTVLEQEELDKWINENIKNRDLFDRLSRSALPDAMTALSKYDVEKAKENLVRKIRPPRHYLIRPWAWRSIAAAAILIFLLGGYFLMMNSRRSLNHSPMTMEATIHDISAPESVHAILTLADGRKIVLDSVNAGRVPTDGSANITKLSDDHLVYNGEATALDEVRYNTLTVPRGSKIVALTLSDGTNVTLNAASSITYPTSFTGSERHVEIEGEGYFEVTHDAVRPFFVHKGTAKIEVLGTHFNVNAYDDEEAIAVTLLEGSVKVSKRGTRGNTVLQPGEMARISNGIDVVRNIDIREVMAWREGKFRFGESADIKTIMRQISRWYDVQIVYKGTVTGHLGGTINREANVSQVLKILEMTGAAKFILKDDTVVVLDK